MRELSTLHIHQRLLDGLRSVVALLGKLDDSAASFYLWRFLLVFSFLFLRANIHYIAVFKELLLQLLVILFVHRFVLVVELLDDQERQAAQVVRRGEARMVQRSRRRRHFALDSESVQKVLGLNLRIVLHRVVKLAVPQLRLHTLLAGLQVLQLGAVVIVQKLLLLPPSGCELGLQGAVVMRSVEVSLGLILIILSILLSFAIL